MILVKDIAGLGCEGFFVLCGALCSCASNETGTEGETLDSEGLIELGRKLHKPMLTLIGMAMRNLHKCGQWSTWSSCEAKKSGYFGSRERKRTCYHELSETNEIATEDFDYDICEGACRRDYNCTAHGSCLKLYTTTKNYDNAEIACKTDGGRLIRIDSLEKYADVRAMLDGFGAKVYVGGKRENAKSHWEFLPKGIQWYSNQPSNGSDELCLYLHNSDSRLADIDCSNNYAFVCELR